MAIQLPPGFDLMDSESKQQALNIALTTEVEKIESITNLLPALEGRVKVLEDAREIQKQLNAEYSEGISALKVLIGKQHQPDPIIVKPKKNIIAQLLSIFKRK